MTGHRGEAALAGLLIGCAVLLSACGEQDASAPSDPTALAKVKQLSPAQADAIEKIHLAALELEAQGGANKRRSRKASVAAIAPVLSACGALDGNDALLSELFRSCAGEGSFLRANADVARCSNPDLCSEAYMAQRTALGRVVAGNRRADRAVAATGLAAACKQVLTTPAAAYAAFRRTDGVLQTIINALESQSRRDRRRAARAARTFTAPARSTQAQLDALRVNCR